MKKEDVAQNVRMIYAEFMSNFSKLNHPDLMDNMTVSDLKGDSWDEAEMAFVIENEYQVEINDEEAANALTVGKMISLVVMKLEEQGRIGR